MWRYVFVFICTSVTKMIDAQLMDGCMLGGMKYKKLVACKKRLFAVCCIQGKFSILNLQQQHYHKRHFFQGTLLVTQIKPHTASLVLTISDYWYWNCTNLFRANGPKSWNRIPKNFFLLPYLIIKSAVNVAGNKPLSILSSLQYF